MYIHRLTIYRQIFFVILPIFFAPFPSSGQQQCNSKFARELVDRLDNYETEAVIRTVIQRYQNHRIYLFKNSNITEPAPSGNSMQIFITGLANAISGSLPCILTLPLNQNRIGQLYFKMPAWSTWQEYSIVDDNVQPGLRVVSLDIPTAPSPSTLSSKVHYLFLPPCRPDCIDTVKVICYRGCDRRLFKLPVIKKEVSRLTFATALISTGTYYWFWRERSGADESFDKYNKATTLETVSRARIEAEKDRTRCNVARGVFFSATGTFAALLVRDLFFRKPEGQRDPSCSYFGNESKFACVPSLTDKELRIDFQFSF